MTFLPFLVFNLLLASFAAHFAFRAFDSERAQRMLRPIRTRGDRSRGRD